MLLSLSEVARYLDVSETLVRKWAQFGTYGFPEGKRVANKLRWDENAIKHWKYKVQALLKPKPRVHTSWIVTGGIGRAA